MLKKIGIVGDRILDIYVHGQYGKIAQEFPIPVFQERNRAQFFGGSENVAKNLLALGAQVDHRYDVSSRTRKIRYVIDNHLVFRSDEDHYDIGKETDFKFDDDVKHVILSDYNKGFLHHSQTIISNLKAQNKYVIVDPKKDLKFYEGANVVKLNEKEFSLYSAESNYKKSIDRYGFDCMIITRAEKSVIIIEPNRTYEIEVNAHQVNDVTGAGDVFIAAFAYYLENSFEEAVRKASNLASLSVTKFGSYILTDLDIRKITPKTVFTNGCFDILHSGHIEYLKQSRKLGDRLIVGLNSDSSVRRLKGKDRPINNEQDRKKLLESLEFVDEVIIFDDDTPYELIKRIQPAIITKGGDYTVNTVVGNDLAEVVIIPLIEGYSTTRILEKMNDC